MSDDVGLRSSDDDEIAADEPDVDELGDENVTMNMGFEKRDNIALALS